jgi:hypothetical protein
MREVAKAGVCELLAAPVLAVFPEVDAQDHLALDTFDPIFSQLLILALKSLSESLRATTLQAGAILVSI